MVDLVRKQGVAIYISMTVRTVWEFIIEFSSNREFIIEFII